MHYAVVSWIMWAASLLWIAASVTWATPRLRAVGAAVTSWDPLRVWLAYPNANSALGAILWPVEGHFPTDHRDNHAHAEVWRRSRRSDVGHVCPAALCGSVTSRTPAQVWLQRPGTARALEARLRASGGRIPYSGAAEIGGHGRDRSAAPVWPRSLSAVGRLM